MTREELMKEIAKRVKDIRELYYSVYPKGDYLTMFINRDRINFNNEHWEGGKDENYQINYHEYEGE